MRVRVRVRVRVKVRVRVRVSVRVPVSPRPNSILFEWWVGARRSHGSGLLVLGLGIPRERLKRQAPRPTERSY